MNLLPTGTQLGKLELLEVYQDVLGPKCFSVKNENTQRFMVYWSGDYDNGQYIKWAYIPVTKPLLASLLNKEVSFHDAFHRSDKLYLATIYTNEVGRPAKVELLNATSKHSANLPPVDFEIDLEEACVF
ncbi:DUF6575 domain-containing protein [Vibrio crassostreae]|uniref:DUF6575 domain-containing protein n=1 Tax=Vibrio crassostreae TaxID=246167 RepID=UPI001048880C|nr:DUF6575 domain-containing protein [Vibrio crassostreae]TCN98645.1 hypothetical protein EDB50_101424 [Vibrio crassostreae]CAK3340747.1 DUF6575 domain-containing protein [Vibrio crassostreae]